MPTSPGTCRRSIGSPCSPAMACGWKSPAVHAHACSDSSLRRGSSQPACPVAQGGTVPNISQMSSWPHLSHTVFACSARGSCLMASPSLIASLGVTIKEDLFRWFVEVRLPHAYTCSCSTAQVQPWVLCNCPVGLEV